MKRLILIAALALSACSSEETARQAYSAFTLSCDRHTFIVEVKDTTDGDRTFFARCKVKP